MQLLNGYRLGMWSKSHNLSKMTFRELVVAYFQYYAIQAYLLLTVACAYVAYAYPTTLLRGAAAVAVAVMAYPLAWFLLHRYVLHSNWMFKSPLTARTWKRIHYDHHQDPNHLEVLFGALYTTLPTIALVTIPIGYAIGGIGGAAWSFGAGLLTTCFYEFCHCIQHLAYKPRMPWLVEMKTRHMEHHFHDEDGNFGITSFVWDKLFGTYYQRPERPEKSETVFNLGYTAQAAEKWPWVASMSGGVAEGILASASKKAALIPAMGGGFEIRPVAGAADRKAFIDLPWALYAHDPAWVPPLKSEVAGLIGGAKSNPWFEHAEAAFWLAWRDGKPVGRVSAQVDQLVLKHMGAGTGQFGMFECIDDPAVAAALLDAAEAWLKAKGMARALGPFSLSIWDEPGLLVSGFDLPPTVMMGHHLPCYEALIEGRGYAGVKDLHTYELPIAVGFPPAFNRIVAAAEKSSRIRMRNVDKSRFAEEAALILDILNDAWSDNWGFIPLTPSEVAYVGKKLKPIVFEDLIRICEVDGEPVAFMITLPDVNEMTGDLNGRLLPFGWAKLLWRLRAPKVRRMRVPLMGVRKSMQGSRLASFMALMMVEHIRRAAVSVYGATQGELGWVLDDNGPMKSIAEIIESKITKTYRIYEKAL